MRFADEIDRSYPGDVFQVTGGKGSIRKAIQAAVEVVKDALIDKYDDDESGGKIDRDSLKIKHIYMNNIRQDLTDFKDIRMFGTVLDVCGYGLSGEKYTYKNACVVEYHVEMFNKKVNQKWTIERFMKEIGMLSIDEGVSLNQLIPLYNKYRIRYHCVDFKYHKTASHNDRDYKANEIYPVLFYN